MVSFKKRYKLIAIVLRIQKSVDAYPKSTQQINFLGNRDRNFSLLKKSNKPLDKIQYHEGIVSFWS